MQRFNSNRIGIVQGDVVLFSDFQSDGEMWAGEGPRLVRQSVAFDEAFASPPAVQLNLSMWDIDSKHNSRVDLSATEVTPEGFVIEFRTWSDTRIARVRVAWTAIGSAPDDDLWDIG